MTRVAGGARAHLTCLLFNDVLIYAKPNKGASKFSYKYGGGAQTLYFYALTRFALLSHLMALSCTLVVVHRGHVELDTETTFVEEVSAAIEPSAFQIIRMDSANNIFSCSSESEKTSW